MRLGIVSTALAGQSLEDGLAALNRLGIDSLELACAGYFADFAPPGALEGLLSYSSECQHELLYQIEQSGVTIDALAIHGQPLTPDREKARAYARQFQAACGLAERLNVSRLTLLAGLPEGAEGDSTPCWAVSAFPPMLADVLEWQWEERLVPYWRRQAAIADSHGCALCFEMHRGDMVFNPRSLLRLRDEIGPVVGCNFDPSHLFVQGIDPLEAITTLGEAIYHVHAKDCEIIAANVRTQGLFDTQPFSAPETCGWLFRTVGYGHDDHFWRQMVSRLRLVGYDSVVSIEHEDDLIDFAEGVEKAVRVMHDAIIKAPPTMRWWP